MSCALTRSGRTEPILDGRVAVEGVTLHASALTPGDLFARQLKNAEFDVSELSMSSLIIATARGARDWVALPVFTTREFFHTNIIVRADSPIRRPNDLVGKRVGVLEYQQTAVIWIRGVLQHEFGVRDVDVEWFMERNPDVSHGGATGFRPPEGVRLQYVPKETSLGRMLNDGDVDAILFYPDTRDGIDVRPGSDRSLLRARPLFDDRLAEGRRYFAKTRIFPINHGMVVRRSIAERYPWVVQNVYAAMVAARRVERAAFAQTLSYYLATGALDGDVQAEPLAYGMTAARPVLETIARYVHEQRLVDRVVPLEEIFAAGVMGT